MFGKAGVDEFDKIDLRTAQNHSWAFENSKRNTFLRDIFCRDLQGISGHHHTKSNYYHAYMNGMYWGLFMTQERAEARFGASYFGGDAADFDVIKAMGWMKPTEVTDGTVDLFRELFEKTFDWSGSNADYFALLGRKPDGSPDPDGKVLVDPDNLIDYMLGIFYTGSNDEAAAWGGDPPIIFSAWLITTNRSGFNFSGTTRSTRWMSVGRIVRPRPPMRSFVGWNGSTGKRSTNAFQKTKSIDFCLRTTFTATYSTMVP